MEAQFVPNASLSFEDDGGLPFTLTKPVTFTSVKLAAMQKKPGIIAKSIRVPAGFKTDMASIPQILWNVLPPIGRYDAAAVVHDYLYQHNGVTRAEADAVLLEAMEVLGVRWDQRWTIYAGVRIGGWKPWNEYRKTDGQ